MIDFKSKGKSSRAEAEALRYAYRLLNYRGRSVKELGERLLKKGFSEDAARNVINHLVEKGFIDDAALAASLKISAEETKFLGSRGVREFLRHRGIPEEIISNIVDECDSGEVIRAKKIVDKKLRIMGNYPDEKRREKIWRALARKGYSFDVIRQALEEFKIKEE